MGSFDLRFGQLFQSLTQIGLKAFSAAFRPLTEKLFRPLWNFPDQYIAHSKDLA